MDALRAERKPRYPIERRADFVSYRVRVDDFGALRLVLHTAELDGASARRQHIPTPV